MHATNQSQTTSKSQERDAAIQITCNSQPITAKTIGGVTYYSTKRRGVEYTAYLTGGGQCWVGTHRTGLGRGHAGGGRYYASLAELAGSYKAFAALPVLIFLAEGAGFAVTNCY